jgi:hypothetical protein
MKTVKKVKKKIIAKSNKENNNFDFSEIKNLKSIQINTRKFRQFDINMLDEKSEFPKIKKEDIEDCIVKINIKIKLEYMHKINISEIYNYVSSNCYILKPITPIICEDIKIRNKDLTTDLSPIEAIEVWLKDKEIKNKKEIFEFSRSILEEEGFKGGN